MRLEEYKTYLNEDRKVPDKNVYSYELLNSYIPPYLLCYGLTLDKDKFFVVLNTDRDIGRFVDIDNEIQVLDDTAWIEEVRKSPLTTWAYCWNADDLRPTKGAFPHFTDLKFARVMRDRGSRLEFFPWWEGDQGL